MPKPINRKSEKPQRNKQINKKEITMHCILTYKAIICTTIFHVQFIQYQISAINILLSENFSNEKKKKKRIKIDNNIVDVTEKREKSHSEILKIIVNDNK